MENLIVGVIALLLFGGKATMTIRTTCAFMSRTYEKKLKRTRRARNHHH